MLFNFDRLGEQAGYQTSPSVSLVLKREFADNKNPEDANLQGIWCYGGVDGTRTRDPRRDRPVF